MKQGFFFAFDFQGARVLDEICQKTDYWALNIIRPPPNSLRRERGEIKRTTKNENKESEILKGCCFFSSCFFFMFRK